MEIWISAETESDIFEEFRLANIGLEDELKPYLATKTYGLELDSLDCIAILRNDDEFKEIQHFSKKNRDMDFRLVIDYKQFKSVSLNQRKQMILDMLVRAVEILSKKQGVNELEAQKLKGDLIEFRGSL